MAKPSYGGWVSFTVHLAKKYGFPLYKIGKRTERLKNGESKLIGFFMGQAMKSLKGNANPKLIQEILKKYIGK